ncbi:hypothetical protein BD410DRAFT_502486 [Rickenella mellea]|uniref:Uncharacterized protein n=1 Tax=Rickenella mellea TaxID=50990 RepID=A0A4Y7PSI3_9AGAM|nr:hypothetical protein BD410DRAFT_502486 [Rickenella mellea]
MRLLLGISIVLMPRHRRGHSTHRLSTNFLTGHALSGSRCSRCNSPHRCEFDGRRGCFSHYSFRSFWLRGSSRCCRGLLLRSCGILLCRHDDYCIIV